MLDRQDDPDDPSGNTHQARVAKLSRAGSVTWEKVFEVGGSNDWVKDGLETLDGDYIVVGSRQFDAWMARLDGDGTVIWQRTYNTVEGSEFWDIEPTADAEMTH